MEKITYDPTEPKSEYELDVWGIIDEAVLHHEAFVNEYQRGNINGKEYEPLQGAMRHYLYLKLSGLLIDNEYNLG